MATQTHTNNELILSDNKSNILILITSVFTDNLVWFYDVPEGHQVQVISDQRSLELYHCCY